MRRYLYLFVTVALLVPIVIAPAQASGWAQKSGKWLVIQNNSFYYNNRYFDESGKNKSLGGYYRKYELNPYFEYGVTDEITVGANLFASRAEQQNSSGYFSNYGVGDSEIFSRFRLWQSGGFSFSTEAMVKLKSFTNEQKQPQIGSKNYDIGGGLSGGYGFSAYGENHFVNVDAGYRHRYGAPHDQLKFAVTAGVSLNKKWQIIPQVFVTSSTGKPQQALFTQSSSDDYNLTKLQISALYKVSSELSLQAGVFKDIAGRNVGDGRGGFFAIQKSF